MVQKPFIFSKKIGHFWGGRGIAFLRSFINISLNFSMCLYVVDIAVGKFGGALGPYLFEVAKFAAGVC